MIVFNSPYSFDKKLLEERDKNVPSKFICSLINFPFINLIPFLHDRTCDAYIKRVIAIPGDKISVSKKGKVYLNGA
jgi:signal peptidase I